MEARGLKAGAAGALPRMNSEMGVGAAERRRKSHRQIRQCFLTAQTAGNKYPKEIHTAFYMELDRKLA